MTEPDPPRRDIQGVVGGVLAILVGVAAYAGAAEFSALGAVFPHTIGLLLVLFGVMLLVMALRGRTRAPAPADGSHVRRAGVALVMAGWAWGLEPIGFLWSSALAFGALLFIANHAHRSPRTLALHGLAGAVLLLGLYALFKHALQVPLP